MGDIVIILVIITENNWVAALKRLLTRVGFVLIPLSILFIRLYPSLGRAYSRGGSPEWTGVGTDKNALGMICMLFGVSLLWRGISTYKDRSARNRKRELVAISIVFIMILYLVLVVNSQTALALLSDGRLADRRDRFWPGLPKARIRDLARGRNVERLVLCACFSVSAAAALSAMGRDSSLTGRTDVWKTVLPYAKSAWFGAGYENFWIGERILIFNRLLGGLNQAHNGYIEIYLNLGWVGLILLGAIIVTGYRNIMKGLRVSPETSRLKLAFFFICLVYNFTEASFKMMSPVWIMFLWAVMVVPMRVPRPRVSASKIQNPYLAATDRSEVQPSFSNLTGVRTTPVSLIFLFDCTVMRLRRRVANGFIKGCGLRKLHGGKLQESIRAVLDEIDLQHLRDSFPCPSFDDRAKMYAYIHQLCVGGDAMDYLEFGVFQGESIRQWVGLNRSEESRFFGFDSFEGLPENWRQGQPAGHFNVDGALPQIPDPRVTFVKGWFDKTVPAFARDFSAKNRLVLHLDADLYGSTMLPLLHFSRFMAKGTLLIFDEFYDREHEFKALMDWQRIYRNDFRIVAEIGNYAKVCLELV